MARRYKIEVHESDEASMLVALNDEYVLSGRHIDDIGGQWTLEFTCDYRQITYSNFEKNNIVRLVDDDLTNDPYITFRIKNRTKIRQGTITLLKVYCEHIKNDLNDRVIKEQKVFVDETPTTILTWILDNWHSDFNVGTLTDSTKIDFTVQYGDKVGDTINRLAEALSDDSGVSRDVYVHGEGTDLGHETDWLDVDIVTRGTTENGTPGTASIEYANEDNPIADNLSYEDGIEKDFASRIIPVGGGALTYVRPSSHDSMPDVNSSIMTIEGAEHMIAYYAGSGVIDFYSKNVILRNDALNGYKCWISGCTGIWTISDCYKGSHVDTIVVSGGSGTPAAGAHVIFYDTDGTTLLNFIPDQGYESTFGVIERKYQNTSIPDLINIAGRKGYGDCSGTYTGGVCQGWAKIGSPTCSSNSDTDYIVNGTKSQKVIAADGEGISFTLPEPPAKSAGEQHFISWAFWLFITALDADTYIHTRIQHGADSDEYFPDHELKDGNERLLGTTGGRLFGVYGGVINKSGVAPVLQIYADGGGATFYVDSLTVIWAPELPQADTWFAWDSRSLLWQEAVADWRLQTAFKETYNVDVIDNWAFDPTTYSAEEYRAGDNVGLVDTGLGIDTTVRVTRREVDIVEPEKVNCDFSNNYVGNNRVNRRYKGEENNSSSIQNLEKDKAKQQAGNVGTTVILEMDTSGRLKTASRFVNKNTINGVWTYKDKNGKIYPVWNDEAR